MVTLEEMRDVFEDAVTDKGASGADRLCRSCVDLLEVDGAALSMITQGQSFGTLGASGDLSRRIDELQFTFGEGPCLDAVKSAVPVLTSDLAHPGESRWPAFSGAVLELEIRAVFALPVSDGNSQVGALDLYRHQPGELSPEALNGGLLAARVAVIPLLQIMQETLDDSDEPQNSVSSWERVEVYQASGMIMGQLNIRPAEALVRLRAYAFSRGMTATEVANGVLNRSIFIEADDNTESQGGNEQ